MGKSKNAVAVKEEMPLTYGRAMEEYGLNPRQFAFVYHYAMNGGNGARALEAAGYETKNMLVAASQASQLLTNVKVRQALNDLLSKQFASPEFVKSRFFSEAINSENKAADRIAATDKLAKIHGMYTEKTVERTVQTVKIVLPTTEQRMVVDVDAKELL